MTVLDGNIENFIGVAQVPVGIAGPLLVDGEHARGTFYVPLATTEGALVASYSRGMKLLYAAGGVRTTVVAEAMQRRARRGHRPRPGRTRLGTPASTRCACYVLGMRSMTAAFPGPDTSR
jgi:Hydroxymethylglutaryl-coenzyme A reductase